MISVFRSEARELRPQTTRSWDFTYLLEANGDPSRVSGDAFLKRANYGKDVIVGVFDSGNFPFPLSRTILLIIIIFSVHISMTTILITLNIMLTINTSNMYAHTHKKTILTVEGLFYYFCVVGVSSE